MRNLKKNKKYRQGKVEKTLPNKLIGDRLTFQEDQLEIIHTPGHTVDSISLIDHEHKIVFVGDNLEKPLVYVEDSDVSRYISTLKTYLTYTDYRIIGSHTINLSVSDIYDTINYLEALMSHEEIIFDDAEVMKLHRMNIKTYQHTKTIIESNRLLLRSWRESDLPVFAEMNSDSEVMRYFPDKLEPSQTRIFMDRIIDNMTKQGYGLYAVEEKSSGDFIGFIGFAHPSFEESFTPCVEIGWRLHKKYWGGQGYATEGAKACLNYGFEILGFDKIVSFTSLINKPSINVMEKIGLVKEGEFDHPKVDQSSDLCRHVLYVLSKDDL